MAGARGPVLRVGRPPEQRFQACPVDTNLFPGGFNNLNSDFHPLCVQATMIAVELERAEQAFGEDAQQPFLRAATS